MIEYTIEYSNWVGSGSMQARFQPSNDTAGVSFGGYYTPDSVWTHITITADRDDTIKSYINGQLHNQRYIGYMQQYEANIDSASLIIGDRNMSLDDIYFFRKALTPAEVLELYNYAPTTSVSELNEKEFELSIYPNPSNGIVNVLIPKTVGEKATLSISNALGQVILSKSIDNLSNSLRLGLSEHDNGLYQISIVTTEQSLFGKFLLFNS